MNLNVIILVIIIIVGILLCGAVILAGRKKISHTIFAISGASVICWSIFNALSFDAASTSGLAFTRMTGLFAIVTVTSFCALSSEFPKRLAHRKRLMYFLATSLTVLVPLSLSDFMVTGVRYSGSQDGLHVETGSLYALFPFYLLAIASLCFYNLWYQYKLAFSFSKVQLGLLWSGIILTTTLAILTNVILPEVTQDWSTVRFGPLTTLPFLLFTAYAILAHRLFDVRVAVARIIGYILTVAVVALIYSVATVLIALQIADIDASNYKPIIIALTITTFFVSLTFHRIQYAITKITTRIFYQDAYSLRGVLDSLTDALVGELRSDVILNKGLSVIDGALKLEGAAFLVVNDMDQWTVLNKTGRVAIAPELVDLSSVAKSSIIDAEKTPYKRLGNLMKSNDIELILRLGPKDDPIAMLMFGHKKSGFMYSGQDLQLLKIAAKNLTLALNNARQYEQISHFADTLQDEVRHATTRLRHANEKLKTLDKMKDDFISMASHQFRTPAGAIRQALHMINSPTLTAAERKEILQLAEASSEQLVTIVGTMLNISRIEAGKFVIDRSLTDLPKLVDKIMLTTGVLAKQKNTQLNFERPEASVMMNVDVAKINEAMANYIENAIKYSPPQSTIQIRLRTEDNKLFFEVDDQGMGVPESERPHLFGKFYRAQNARREQPDGNGIGLYVVKQIVEGHGGEAFYQPLSPTGSRFGFWLPLLQASSK